MSVAEATPLGSVAPNAEPARATGRAITGVRVGVGILALVVLVSILSPLLYPHPNEQHLGSLLQAPSLAHPMGTDNLGRDVFARALHAGLLDLAVAAAMTYVPLLIGVLLGSLAGYHGRWIDTATMRVVDLLLALPYYAFVLVVIAIVGPGLKGVLVAVFAVSWTGYARLARAEMLVVRERQYIAAAQTLGFSTARILGRHALPNVLRPCLVYSMADIVLNITLIASLSFLGLGVQPPTPEWGSMIADGQVYLLNAWWIATLPGVMLILVGTGFSLVGDGLADRLGESGAPLRLRRRLRRRRPGGASA